MISNEKLELLSLEAAQEIGETATNLVEAVENLKKFLQENYNDLTLPPNPDDFLLRFLRGSKFDISQASKKLSKYSSGLHGLKDIHHLRNSSVVERLFQDGVLTIAKERDSKGRTIVLYRQEFLPPVPNWIEAVVVGIFILADYLHRSCIHNQRIGFVFVADFSTFSWSHCRYINPRVVMAVTKIVAQGNPGSIKGYHIVRNPALFGYLMALIKPFLSKKMKSRLHFHGWNFQEFHEHVEPQSFPKYLGGEVSDDEFADGEIFSKIDAEDDYITGLFKFGYNQ